MKDLILDLIPHAPKLGLYVTPDVPEDKVRGALKDYATDVRPDEVVALYDATLMGSAKDGAVFTSDRLVFQNNDLEPAQIVRYQDLVRVEKKRKLLGGQKVYLNVNRGRATFDLALDFSGKPEAAEFVARFLHEAMLRGAADEMDAKTGGTPGQTSAGTDLEAVVRALDELREQGLLADADYAVMLDALRKG
ncbi:MAG: hypothetical protein ACR2GR_04540 [Rhodothermales bacterium]